MTATQPSLHDKVLAAAKEAGYVQKSGRNTAQSYNFAGDEAISAKFREAMLAQGVLVYPSKIEFESITPFAREGKDTPNVLVHVRGEFTITDGIESFTAQSLGSGMDVGDKAVFKALTGFKKYAYRMLVMMVTGDDPETAREDEKPKASSTKQVVPPTAENPLGMEQSGTPVPATQSQKNLIRAKQHEIGLTDKQLGDLRVKVTGKLTSKDFSSNDISAMLSAFEDPTILAAVVSEGEVVEESKEAA